MKLQTASGNSSGNGDVLGKDLVNCEIHVRNFKSVYIFLF